MKYPYESILFHEHLADMELLFHLTRYVYYHSCSVISPKALFYFIRVNFYTFLKGSKQHKINRKVRSSPVIKKDREIVRFYPRRFAFQLKMRKLNTRHGVCSCQLSMYFWVYNLLKNKIGNQSTRFVLLI